MALVVVNGPTIAAGQSLSSVVNLTAGRVLRLTMPAAWDAVPLTFQVSTDGVFFNDLFDKDGNEITVYVTPGAGVIFHADVAYSLAYMKFRSGTRGNPVPQAAQRDFAVAIDTKLIVTARAKTKTKAAAKKKKAKR